MTIDLSLLAVEFSREAVGWRAQIVYGDRALALPYIDARDVMTRLDTVAGSENWQTRYEFHGSRTICYLAIKINGEWIWKADGAGDTQVEAEKGAISDALKRAAVCWGIGRYLYALPTVWVPCDLNNGKWKGWKEDPWEILDKMLKKQPTSSASKPATPRAVAKTAETEAFIMEGLRALVPHCKTVEELDKLWKDSKADRMQVHKENKEHSEAITKLFGEYKTQLSQGAKQ